MSDKTDLWYPFYIGDYHRDTMHLSTLQHGAYRLIMDAYWVNKGPLPADDAQLSQIAKLSLSDWAAIRSVIVKFFIEEQSGCPVWRHRRIDKEVEKAGKQKHAKSLAAQQTNLKRWKKQSKPSLSDSLSDSQNPSLSGAPSPSPSHIKEPEREPPFQEYTRPSLKEVLDMSQIIGLAPWKAEDWWNEMQGCGWLDFHHRPVLDWRAVMVRVRTKWESDGRPMSPPKPRNSAPEPKRKSIAV